MKDQKIDIQVNFGGAIFLILLILKLAKVVSWSWWIIFLPIWLPLLVVLGAFTVACLIAFFQYIFK